MEKNREFRRKVENVGEGLFQSAPSAYNSPYLCIVIQKNWVTKVFIKQNYYDKKEEIAEGTAEPQPAQHQEE